MQRRQAEKFADRDANIYAQREQAYEQQVYQQQAAAAPVAAAPVAAAPAAPAQSVVEQLKDLAELKNQGILTEAEFEAQKAKILNS